MRRIGFFGVGLLLSWGLLLARVQNGGPAEILIAGLSGTGQTQFYLLLFLVLQSLLILFLWPHVRRQKQAQQALRGSEERFNAAAAAISDALVAIDEQGRVVLFNPSAERLFGYRREQMLGQTLDCLLPKRYRERHREMLENYFADGASSQIFDAPLELPALRADGGEIVVELSLSLLADGDSRTVLAAMRDISRRKADEEALRLSEKRFRELADLLPQSVFEADLQGKVTFANRMALQIAGWSDDDLARQPSVMDILRPEDRQRATTNFQRVLSGELLLNEEYTLQAGDGSSPLTVVVAAAPIVRHEQVIGLRGIAVDVTERLSVEQLARENSEKFKRLFQEYQALLDHIPDAITLYLPDLTVVRSNQGAARLLGLPVTELPGTHCSALWVGCSAAGDHCPVERCFRSGQVEQAFTKTDDGRSWHVRAFPVCNKDGERVNVISLASDVTRQRQLEQEASRANHLASLGELAAGVAHEINNPINGIINYAQILADDGQIGEDNREVLRGITEEGERIANIVYNLLFFARDRHEAKTPVSLEEVLSATLALTESQLRKDKILLAIHVAPDLPEVNAHFQQLQQVILNIISNARYALNQRYPAGHEGKTFSIRSEWVQDVDDPRVRLVFHDGGTGIPVHQLPKILDPFYTTKPSGSGTGLGLSISHGIIEDHGGRLDIESIEGRYTKVAIELPIAKGNELL
jgi:PAS domain S-box-containing protein